MPEYRLGDILDDRCSRCGDLTNHSIVALADGEPALVRCRTCSYEHKYRKGKGGAKKPASRKADLFDQVLAKIQRPPGMDE